MVFFLKKDSIKNFSYNEIYKIKFKINIFRLYHTDFAISYHTIYKLLSCNLILDKYIYNQEIVTNIYYFVFEITKKTYIRYIILFIYRKYTTNVYY